MLLGSLDASMIWNAVAHVFREKLDIVPIPKDYLSAITSATYKESDLRKIKVTAGITAVAKEKPHVQKFFAFIKEHAPEIFARNGFTPAGVSATETN
ncbi:MAG: substrate-binding domain-containing protein [bacterium]